MSRISAVALALLVTMAPAPAFAQDGRVAEQASAAARDRWSILAEQPDPCVEERAAADPDTIVVCEEKAETQRYMSPIPRPVDGDRGAPRAPDLFGIPPCESYQVCTRFGNVPPPAIMVDFDALPETPEGSPAARWGGPTAADSPPHAASLPSIEPDTDLGLSDEVIGP